MSYWPMGSKAYGRMVSLYGFGDTYPPVVPQDTVLVGGQNAGKRVHVPVNRSPLYMPIPTERAWTTEEPMLPLAPREEVYEGRTLIPCFDGSPVRVWVLKGLEDDAALALYQEWR